MFLNFLRFLVRHLALPVSAAFYRLGNSESGKSCYILGDGPSIKFMDLHCFGDLPSIATNEIINHVEFDALNCKYWLMPEPLFHWPRNASFISIDSSVVKQYKKGLHPRSLLNQNVTPVLNALSYPFTFHSGAYYFYYGKRHFKNLSIAKREDAFSGTINSAITIAIYLGFKKIYLLGFDYTHEPSKSLHWYEFGQGLTSNHSGYNVDFFKEALKHIEIVTVTIDSKSETLPFITYQDLTGKIPIYRENFEILNKERLSVLKQHISYSA